jgi:transposase-like protein
MKTKEAPKDLTLIQIFDKFGTEAKARKHLEAVLWKDGIVCPHCQCPDQAKFSSIAANPDKKVRAGLRWCAACQKQFTVTIGTIFEDSHIPLRKWLIAWYLLCSSKKGISSLQLQRILELGSYRSALFMTHRIRHALKETGYADLLEGTIEADETIMGGYAKGQGSGYRAANKTPVIAMVQRGGKVRSQVMPTVNGANLRQAIRENVKTGAKLNTDAHKGYTALGGEYDHSIVRHVAGEYSRHEGEKVVSTASVESFFSLLKRGVMGTFHHISRQHLPLYLAEFEHRHNCRKLTDGQRTDLGLTKVTGKRLIYKAQ